MKIAGYFGYSESANELLKLCRDSSEQVRCAAIEHLLFIEDERAVEVLVRALTDETPKVRAAAARALRGAHGWAGGCFGI